MNSLRIWILTLVVWLPLMVSVEHTLVLPEYRHNILLFLLSTVAVVLLSPKPLPSRLTVFGFVLAFIATGILQNGLADELENPFLTATRIGAIMVTGLIAHQINTRLYRVEEAISDLALSDFLPLPANFSDDQTSMYREMQRARHHGRPLSLVMLKIEETSMKQAIPRVAEELRQSMVKKFMLAKVAHVLNEHLPRFHTFALRNDCFVAALPETTTAEANALIENVNAVATKELGLTMRAGISALSDQVTTFGNLVDLAEERLKHADAMRNGDGGSDGRGDSNGDGHSVTELFQDTYGGAFQESSPEPSNSGQPAEDDSSELVLDRSSHHARNG